MIQRILTNKILHMTLFSLLCSDNLVTALNAQSIQLIQVIYELSGMLNQKNTDNMLYNEPYQLVPWTISTKGKCTSVQPPLPAGADREGDFFPIASLAKPPLWASVWSKRIERTAYI